MMFKSAWPKAKKLQSENIMKLRNLLVLGSMAVMGAAFTSCSKDIAYDNEGLAKEALQQLNAEYDANFVKKYGAIDPNQTWDFATMTPVYSLPSTSTRAGETRGTVELKSTGTLTIDGGEGSVFDWLSTNMPAGQNHSQVGSPFKAVMSRNTFIVAPFYQGYATYFWELWVNVNGNEYKIWEKYKDLKYKKEGDDKWYTLDKYGIPKGVVKVQAPTYTFTATEGSQLYFFMKVWTGGDNAHANDPEGKHANKILTSLESGNMRALQKEQGLPKPAGVPDDYFAYLIGCEDGAPDGDFEDLGFLFFGPPIKGVEEVEVRETKRYMMEDLGATDDFDFNDVVVDVSNVWTKKITRQENASTGEVAYHEEVLENSKRQEAIVRAAGGIYDFELKIGTTDPWKKSDDLDVTTMWNTGKQGPIDYNAELAKFNVTGWIPGENNIELTVFLPDNKKSAATEVKIQFPRKGTAPKMIAFDAGESWNWMKERQSVPGGTGSEGDWWFWTNEQ
jgi:hypothetical protein